MKSLVLKANQTLKKNRRNNKGFTLVELIIVIAIIAVLAAVLAPQYIRYVERSRRSADVDTFSAIVSTVNVLVADGTINADETFTWDVANGGLTTDTDATDAILAMTGTIPAAQSDRAQAATPSVAVDFTDAGDVTITVTPDDYSTAWVATT